MLVKFEIYFIFPWVNDLNINKKNNLLRAIVKFVVVQFSRKKTCILPKICCALLAFIFPDPVWYW